jgi:protein-arginine kinase activator protein McsA
MKVTKKVMRKQSIVKDIECDICGNSCKRIVSEDKKSWTFEYATLFANWGYGSNNDGDSTELHICENCVRKIGEHFNIKDKLFKEGYNIVN